MIYCCQRELEETEDESTVNNGKERDILTKQSHQLQKKKLAILRGQQSKNGRMMIWQFVDAKLWLIYHYTKARKRKAGRFALC